MVSLEGSEFITNQQLTLSSYINYLKIRTKYTAFTRAVMGTRSQADNGPTWNCIAPSFSVRSREYTPDMHTFYAYPVVIPRWVKGYGGF